MMKSDSSKPQMWHEKRYHSLDSYLKTTFGEKVYKISLNAGMTCPNRDGKLGTRGCIFCSAGGSGDFAGDRHLSITEQIDHAKSDICEKFHASKYIAYFQAYTNTYASIEYLRKVFTEAIEHPDIVIVSIATRPDCLGPDVLELLEELNKIKPIWIELGLQTIHESTATLIRRGYPLSCFEQANDALNRIGIPVIVHTILGLPGETKEQMLETIDYVANLHVFGIKLQLLHILEGTDLKDYYYKHPFHVLSFEEYVELITTIINRLPSDIVIHRITGDGPKKLLIEPQWSTKKKQVLNAIHKNLKETNSWQGKEYQHE